MHNYKKNFDVVFDQPVLIMYNHFVIKTAINRKKESSDLMNYRLHVPVHFFVLKKLLILHILFLFHFEEITCFV